jgi:hypothetical protein
VPVHLLSAMQRAGQVQLMRVEACWLWHLKQGLKSPHDGSQRRAEAPRQTRSLRSLGRVQTASVLDRVMFG